MSGRKRTIITSDESEEDTNVDTRDSSETSPWKIEHAEDIDIAPSDIDPVKMRSLIKEFQEYVDNKNKKSTRVKSMNIVAEKFLKASSSPELNVELFLNTFRNNLSAALKQRNVSIWNSLNCIDDYMDGPEFIETYSDYPRNVPLVRQYYAKKNNLPLGRWSTHSGFKVKFANDTEGRKRCEDEVQKLEERYLENLEAFAKNHPELNERQQVFLNNKIETISEKLRKRTKTRRAVPLKPENKKATAFDLYLATVTEKYNFMDTEPRIEKLKKKYAKLSEEVRKTFEKIAGTI